MAENTLPLEVELGHQGSRNEFEFVAEVVAADMWELVGLSRAKVRGPS